MSASAPPPAGPGRFAGLAADYDRHRPGYPEALVRAVADFAALGPGRVVADVGAGTGIWSEALARTGARVLGVEPDAGMRAAAERRLAGVPAFAALAGTAEATTLPDASVDLVTAAQASHWFDPPRTRAEWLRIGRTSRAALLWNSRRASGTPLLDGFEALLQTWAVDYREVKHTKTIPRLLETLFEGRWRRTVVEHAQRLDRDGLVGLVLSTSYVPGPQHPNRAPLLAALDRLFDEHARDGQVELLYDGELYLGELRDVR